MNTLHINSNYTGNALHQNMANCLSKKNESLKIFVPVCPKTESVISVNENVIVSECFNKFDRVNFYGKQKKIMASLKSKVNPQEFDLVHAYTVFTDGNIAYSLYKEYKIPYVVAVRNTDINTFFKYMVHLRKRGIEILKNASAIFFLSGVYKKRLFNSYLNDEEKNVIDKKSYIIPNGIDDFWLKNLYSDKAYESGNKEIRVCSVGTIDKNKNMLSVAESLKILENKGYKVKLYIAGKISDKKIFEKLKKFDFVNYEGRLSKEKLIEVYRKSDVFVLPSFKESFGMVYVEAMSQSLPIIYTKSEGFDGRYPEGLAGYSVSAGDVSQIVQKTEEAFLKRESIGANCIKEVNAFCRDKIADEYISIYKSIYFNK